MPYDHHLLPVPGARLYYETRGAGPLLLLISGGNGDTKPYARLADLLAERFTVVTYERRGFANSPLDAPPNNDTRLAVDVEDAYRLITQLGGPPAHVFGSSSGAIVALFLLAAHGAELGTVVAHEPPLVKLLPDPAHWLDLFAMVRASFHREGPILAMQQFTSGIGLHFPGTGPAPQGPPDPHRYHNLQFWIDHELGPYPAVDISLEALIRARERLVLANGEESGGSMPCQPNLVLAERLGLPVVEFAGDHIGYALHPERFAVQLTAVL